MNVRAKITEASPLTLYVTSAANGEYLSLFSVSAGKISHAFDPATLGYQTADFALSAGEFFELNIYVEKANGVDTVNYTITTDGGATLSGYYSYDNSATDFLGGKFAFDSAYLSVTEATFAFVEMYPGSYQRYVDNSKNVDVIAEKLVAVYNTYLEYNANDAFELAEIISNIAVRYEYPVDDISNEETKAEVVNAFNNCVAAVSKAYESNIAYGMSEMLKTDNASKPYNSRLDLVNEVLSYEAYMTNLETGSYAASCNVDFEAVKAAFDVADAENAALEVVEADSVFVIEAVSGIANIYLATYEDLKSAYELIADVEIDATYYSELYSEEAVADAVYKRNVVVSNYPTLDAKAKAFVSGVTAAVDTNNDFSTRYAAYASAKANIFNDATYDKYLTNVTVAELNEMFAAVDVEMRAVSEVAEAFLSKIREAEQTPSYTVKIKALDDAKPYIGNVEVGYPEVAEAIESYYAMRADVTARQEAARRYVQAVINVQIASSVKEKLAAIAIAESFAVLGNESSVEIEGMSMTVTEANIVLANEKASINLKATRINNYVAAVSDIATKNDLLSRRQAISYALSLKADLVLDLADEEDVVDASRDLESAIAAYNDDVNEANSVAEETETAALTLLTKTIPTKRIAEIIAIVKKFYE